MERNRRWVITPRRLIISAIGSIAAIFVSFAAWGMGDWTVLSIGLAIFAAAVALAVISALNSKIRGVAHVIEINAPPAGRYRGRVIATAVIRYRARRETVRVVLQDDDIPLNKWPAVHDELPVVGLTSDLWSAEVLWSQVPTHKRIAARRRRAEARATAATAATAGTENVPPVGAAGPEPGFGSASGTATATAEHVDEATEEYAEADEVTGDASTPTEAVPAESSEGGKVVDGEWWDSLGAPGGARLQADITTPDEAPPTVRPPGSRPSPRPRTSPEDVIISVDFGSAPPQTPADDSPDSDAPPPAFPSAPADPPPSPFASPWPDGASVPHQPTRPRHAAREHREDLSPTNDRGADAEDGMFGDATSSLRTSPLQVKRAGILAASVPIPRGDDEPYDHAYDNEAVAQAYRDALPPPGVDRPGRADVTVQLFVSNLSRAIIFYRDILGFTEIDAGRASAVLDLRDVRVILKVVDDLLPSSKNVQFSLEVDDLEMAYEDLRARGVRFVHRPRRVEHYEQLEHFAVPFEDPDGHRISLSSWRAIYDTER